MRSTLEELVREMAELRAFVASIARVNAVLAGHQDSLVQQYLSIRRRFDYAAFTVALYASFEKFIEDLVAAYARLEARRVRYADLPPKLVKKHSSRTGEMLMRGRFGEGRHTGLREVDVVQNLFECLNGVIPYTLNDAAVVAHDLNLNKTVIDSLFTAIGIEKVCERVRWADALLNWYCTINQLSDQPPGGVPERTLEERFRDIVERRNQVAHRGGNPGNLPGVEAMSDAIDFIEAVSKSVFALAAGRYLQVHHAESGQGVLLQQRLNDGPYRKGTVVVVEKPAERLFVGQPLFVIYEATGARWGRIQSMKVDDIDVQAVEPDATAAKGVGIALDFKCPEGATLVALAVEDDVVWSLAAGKQTASGLSGR